MEDLSNYQSPLWQPHHAFADDVVLNLAGAARDSERARCEHPVRPLALVERVRSLEVHLAVRSEQLHREFVHAQIELAHREFQHRALGARRQTLEAPRDLTKAGIFYGCGFARELRDLLAHVGVVPRRRAIVPHALREVAQFLDCAEHVAPAADARPLEHQGGDRDLPSLILLADEVLLRHLHIFEENLVKIRVAGDLYQRPHRHTRAMHIDEDVTDALVLRGRWIGAREQDAHVGVMRIRGPYLLSVDDEVVAFLDRTRLQRRHIGTGAGLRISLAPDFLARQNLRHVALLLFLGSPMDDGRADQHDAEAIDQRGRAGPGHLFVVDDLLNQVRAASAVFLRPANPDPSGGVRLLMPR